MAIIEPSVSALSQAPVERAEQGPFRARERERKRKLSHRVRQSALGLLVLAGALGTALALRPRPVPVDLGRVSRGALEVTIQESGITRVEDRYEVSAPVTGRLSRLTLQEGDAVHEGDALAEIAPALSPLLDDRT